MSDGTKVWFDFFNAYTRAPKELLPHASRTILGSLLSFANGPDRPPVLGNARPGVDRLVTLLGMSESTVRKALSDLRHTGWITSTSGARGGTHYATTYQLQVPTEVRVFLDHRDAEMKARRDTRSDDETHTPPKSPSPGVREPGGEGSEKSDPTYSLPTHVPTQAFHGQNCVLTPREVVGEQNWKKLLDNVQALAADQWSAEAGDNLEETLREATYEEIADWQVNYFHTPPQAAVDRRLAGKWLNTLFNTARSEGFDYAPVPA
ncbi:helix-turn-helix domain-containing protein [Kocuria kalidii]|uniref:helix-turn-helix domain-containing protein n=1 Tax=Kocuria kalidii TaxID=3376283 RepID=UPI00378A8A52